MNFGNLLNWLSQTVSIKLEMISVAVLLTSGMVIGFTYSGFILLINLCMCPVLSTLAPVFAINTSGHIRISTVCENLSLSIWHLSVYFTHSALLSYSLSNLFFYLSLLTFWQTSTSNLPVLANPVSLLFPPYFLYNDGLLLALCGFYEQS